MTKNRKYKFAPESAGLAFAGTGCGPTTNLINPNVTMNVASGGNYIFPGSRETFDKCSSAIDLLGRVVEW